jgi:hypothetical protein
MQVSHLANKSKKYNNHHYFDKNLVPGPKGPIDRSKKINQKNAAKGQNSLSKYLGSQIANGLVSNKAAFNHYSVSSNTYNTACHGGLEKKSIEEHEEE